ncbi:MAG: histidinol-phosphatase [Solirubrobacterales bacterium]|nr:histidinol-phosphatase [Solirubrobacterales bacterium]
MLTDYHVHLRPDGPGSDAEDFFTAENAARYREHADEHGIAELGVSEHVYRFTAALDVWQHDLWRGSAKDDIDAYCAFVREDTDLRLGIEADFIPGTEDRMADLLDARDWDYVIGSIHFLGDYALDMEKYDIWGSGNSPEKVWGTYFTWLGHAAMSGLFDVLAHPDLVKHWGRTRPFPQEDLRSFYELAIDGIASSGVAIEVSTAGLRKPVQEIYPAPGFLEMCIEAGCPIALSSDAHTPEQLGFGYQDALLYLADLGVTELATFDRRTRIMEPLG